MTLLTRPGEKISFTTFEPTHLPNPTTFAEQIRRERGKMSFDPTHLPNPNYTGLGRVKGKMSLDQTHDNFELDLLEHNKPTLHEESDNNPTFDEESTLFLTRIKKSIRNYIGFCRMPKCLMMFIGSLALIARVISLGITRLIVTLALIATVHYLNLMRFGGRLFVHLLLSDL